MTDPITSGSEQTESSILLHNGDWFDFKDPFEHSFDIETIAYSLSNLCRYTGHSKRFYSVAEHSILVSQIVQEPYALEGLMHDASEAFCGDVSSPLKKLVPQFKKIEENVQKALFEHYGLTYPLPDCIHQADKIAYATERQSIANTGIDELWYTQFKPKQISIVGYSPAVARKKFLDRFEELTSERNAVLQPQAEERAAAA